MNSKPCCERVVCVFIPLFPNLLFSIHYEHKITRACFIGLKRHDLHQLAWLPKPSHTDLLLSLCICEFVSGCITSKIKIIILMSVILMSIILMSILQVWEGLWSKVQTRRYIRKCRKTSHRQVSYDGNISHWGIRLYVYGCKQVNSIYVVMLSMHASAVTY